jgi:hypothetical protein
MKGKVQHKLTDIVTITICAVICGCDDWTEIVLYAERKKDWLATLLELPNGIPSHDTFSRVFSMLSPERFGKMFFKLGKFGLRKNEWTGYCRGW